MDDLKGSYHHWVLAKPREASGAQPPFVEAGHLLHKVAPVRAKVQQSPPMPDAAGGRVPSQDQEHLPQRFGRQVLLLEPHAIFTPAEGPHPAGAALERGNSA